MSEESKSFTVKDRRQFTAEGERRDEAAPESAVAEPASPAPPPATAEPAGGEATAVGEPAGQTEPGPVYPSDFSSLLQSLAAQATLLLIGDPDGGGVDLAGARALITLLEVLEKKTEGRRTEPEEKLLEGLLYELRMAYVARSRAAGR